MKGRLFAAAVFALASSVAKADVVSYQGTNSTLAAPNEIAISPDGKNAYMASQNSDALTVYSRNTTTGALTQIQQFVDGPGGVDSLDTAWGVEVSADGRNVYVSAEVTQSPSGDYAVNVFSRDLTSGLLAFVQSLTKAIDGVAGFEGPQGMAISRDQNFVYAAGVGVFGFEGAIAVFERNATTGHLTYRSSAIQGYGGVDGIDGTTDIAISPDDQFVYVTGQRSDSVAVFSRNATNGALTFVEAKYDGVDGVAGLDLALGLTLSEDGNYLYVASVNDAAVALFAVNKTTGGLTFIKHYYDGLDGIAGLGGASKVEIHPSGYVFVTAVDDDALVVFVRDKSTGELSYVETLYDGVGGVDGLGGARFLSSSPDGSSIYVTGFYDDKIARFSFGGCFSAENSSLKIKKKLGSPKSSLLRWKWRHGALTSLSDIGDRASEANYTLTVFDAGGEHIRLELPEGTAFPTNPWKASSDGYSFSDSTAVADGFRKGRLEAGEAGESSAFTLHKGVNLALPSSLAFTPPVTVRLENNSEDALGVCWESRWTTLSTSNTDSLLAK